MRYLISLTLVILTGCGGPAIEGAFVQYVERFEAEAANQGRSVEVRTYMKFADLETDLLGRCFPMSNRVEVDRRAWAKMDEDEREMLIFHELGHCTLHRPHRSDVRDGHPVSLMYPQLMPGYGNRRAALMAELFSL